MQQLVESLLKRVNFLQRLFLEVSEGKYRNNFFLGRFLSSLISKISFYSFFIPKNYQLLHGTVAVRRVALIGYIYIHT